MYIPNILWFYGERKNDVFFETLEKYKFDFDTISDVNSDQVKEWVDIRKKLYESEDPFIINVEDDISSHFVMRILCAANSAITEWIISKETELFIKRMQYHYINVKKKLKEILNYVFMEEIRQKKTRTATIYQIMWFWAAKIVFQWNNVNMKNGWINIEILEERKDFIERYSKLESIVSDVIKTTFRKSFKDFSKSLTPEIIEPYKIFAQFVFADVVEIIDFSKSLDDIGDIINQSPMCIINLDNFLQKEGLGYDLIIQLSLYMKTFLSIDNLIAYFYKRDIRNKGYPSLQSFIDDHPDLIYHLEHQYGSGGSGINYNAMGCAKSRARGYCFFMNSPSIVGEKLHLLYDKKDGKKRESKEENKVNRVINAVKDAISHRNYSKACWLEKCLRTNNLDMKVKITMIKGKPKISKSYINHSIGDYYKSIQIEKETKK